ncbi:MAG: efflux RND transporter permease subunit, partial [Candidatus Cloacimonetes bacterium]|nr:efflux RND transporter permease subunit [Candidatus Cloacimonadota bacterium]
MKISNFALGNMPAVYVLILISILTGTLSYINLPREASPDIQIPFVIVTTVYPGTSPQDMESLITNKLEQELVDIDNIKEMKSFSQESVSNITLEFDPEEDV